MSESSVDAILGVSPAWENPAWDIFVTKYPKELEPKWEDRYCPLSADLELRQPVASSAIYGDIAKSFDSNSSTSSFSAYCILGACRYGLMGGSQQQHRRFEVQARRAATAMGYEGSNYLRFFLHKMRLWYCADLGNVGGFDYKDVAQITSYKEHDAHLTIGGVFQVAADFCWDLETRNRAVPRASDLESENPAVGQVPVTQPTIRRRRNHVLSDHEKGIRTVIRERVIGKRYAERLSENGISPRESWVKRGCPKSYKLAFEDIYWRELIQKEKSRVTSRMNKQSLDQKKSQKISAPPAIT